MPALDHAEPAALLDNLETDEPYLALTEYVLRDGTKARGYCFVYDATGFAIFQENGSAVPVSDQMQCTPEEALSLSQSLGRQAENIFPIHFRAMVKVLGTVPKGEITLQPNPPLQRTRQKQARR